MALAPISSACFTIKSNDCWRVFSHKVVNSEMFPPTKVYNEPPIEPKIDLERTVMPRTKPKFWVIFLPGSSKAVVMFFWFIFFKKVKFILCFDNNARVPFSFVYFNANLKPIVIMQINIISFHFFYFIVAFFLPKFFLKNNLIIITNSVFLQKIINNFSALLISWGQNNNLFAISP